MSKKYLIYSPEIIIKYMEPFPCISLAEDDQHDLLYLLRVVAAGWLQKKIRRGPALLPSINISPDWKGKVEEIE